MKLQNTQDAIEQAIEGGWKYRGEEHEKPVDFDNDKYCFIRTIKGTYDVRYEQILTDPLFWQALGKARGWDDGTHRASNGELTSIAYWRIASRKWFEIRIESGDETKFWESLP